MTMIQENGGHAKVRLEVREVVLDAVALGEPHDEAAAAKAISESAIRLGVTLSAKKKRKRSRI